MTQWIALLRGINVGGNNVLPMAGLRAICEALWPDSAPRTYIASGNMILNAPDGATTIATDLGAAIKDVHGLDVPVFVLADVALREALARCPFEGVEGKFVHAFFCFTNAQIDAGKRDALMVEGEALVQVGSVIWLLTPLGISKSKLADKLGQVIGPVPTTARNLNTLRKLVEMLDA